MALLAVLDELIDSKQLAKELGVNPQWPAQNRLSGRGPAYVKIGRLCRYRRSDVENFLKARAATSTSGSTPTTE
jgi:hypothetical protein